MHAETFAVEVRITRTLRLGGRYWLGASSGTVQLRMDDSFEHEFSGKSTMEIPRGEHTIQLTGTAPAETALHIVFVAERTLVPEREFLVEPPAQPPPSVSSIR